MNRKHQVYLAIRDAGALTARQIEQRVEGTTPACVGPLIWWLMQAGWIAAIERPGATFYVNARLARFMGG